jgi:hypothetical protein
VTIAAARFMIGTQSESVTAVTRIAPGVKLEISAALASRQTRPLAIASPTAAPVSNVSPLPSSV